MVKPEEYAMGNIANNYCVHCARPDGSMQNYEEKLDSLAGFLTRTQGLDEKAARIAAQKWMSHLPAWQVK
jgi:hypothetical protein